MALYRSPTKGPIKCTDGNDTIATRCASHPDLRQSDTEISKYLLRKRKTPDDDDFSDKFEIKIMSILTKMAQTQTDKLDKISQQVSIITDQISQIKCTTDQLSVEQNRFKEELVKIESSKKGMQKEIDNLKDDFKHLKNSQSTTIFTQDNMISEVHERLQREKNIVISGIVEINSKDPAERIEHDKHEVIKVIKLADPDCAEPTKWFRLGKYMSNKSRPIKVCFTSADTTKSILRNKNLITKEIDNIKCYSDQTPLQKEELVKLRTELSKRVGDGEENIIIKYIKGVPKIVKMHSKNLQKQKPKEKTYP